MEISAKGAKGHHTFKLNVNEAFVSGGGDNYSKVSFDFSISAVQNGWDWSGWGNNISYIISINGNSYIGTIPAYDGKSTVTLYSGTIDVPHNDDGSKTIAFSFNVIDKANQRYTSGDASQSDSLVLTKITRQANLTNADNFNDESNPTIYYSNPAGNNVNSLMACISLNGSTDNISYRDVSKTGNSYTFNLTETERNILRSAMTTNSLNIKFYLRTIIGNDTFSSILDRTITLVNGNPTFENFSYKDTNENITSITGNNQILIKGLSNLKVEISSANKMITNKQATAKNYIATIDKKNITTNYSNEDITIDLGTISSFGQQRLSVRAYDSRNNSKLVYKDINILDYDKPVINATALRLNNFENTTTLSVSGTFSKIVIDEIVKNVLSSIQYRYRELNGTWNDWQNISFKTQDINYSCTDIILDLDNTKSFEFEIKVTDSFSENIISVNLNVGEAIFFISSNKKACYINGQEILTYDIVDEWEENT